MVCDGGVIWLDVSETAERRWRRGKLGEPKSRSALGQQTVLLLEFIHAPQPAGNTVRGDI
jgi:hypothetical protein